MNLKTIRLFILRHAVAEDRDEERYPDDSIRPLSQKGKKKMRYIAESINQLGFSFDLILSSPYLRARQTAEISAQALFAGDRLFFSDHLAPSGNMLALMRELVAQDLEGKTILLVGHEPYLSNLISLLCAGDFRATMRLKKGGLCFLTAEKLIQGQCATLEWLLTPSMLLRML
jgi:phosphohistidine phosphatase